MQKDESRVRLLRQLSTIAKKEWKPSSGEASGRRGNGGASVKTQRAGEGGLNGMEIG